MWGQGWSGTLRGTRMNQHRRPSSNPAQTSAVYTHLKSTGHAFTLTDVVVLDTEEHWHRRGVKEAIWERVENPSLNRKGGLRHSLSHTWDRTMRLIGNGLSRGTSVLSVFLSVTSKLDYAKNVHVKLSLPA